MTAKEIILVTRQLADKDLSNDLINKFCFKPDKSGVDINIDIRTNIVEELLNDFSLQDIILIRKLFDEELKCEIATQRHDNLYQLSFYLFHLGQLQDAFILYDAKYNAKNMDVGCSLDRELITLGHNFDIVIEYVEKAFKDNPTLEEKYSGIIQVLEDLRDHPDYESIDDYRLFIRGYFYGHEKI